MSILLKRDGHGFQFGPANVSAVCSDDKKGWAVVGVQTLKHAVQVYVTKTGRVRVHVDGKEFTQGSKI